MNVKVEYANFAAKAFDQGGPVMYIILVILILTLLLIIERTLTLKSLRIDRKDFIDNIFGMILRGDLRQAISYCDARPTPLTLTIKAGLVQALNKRPDEEIQVAMDAAILREQPRLEGWSSFLAVTGNVGLLTGLLGTILGMIKSFGAVADTVDPARKGQILSEGISHALWCTSFGLLVAIISIVAYGYFMLRIQRAENEVMEASMSVLNLVASNRDKIRD